MAWEEPAADVRIVAIKLAVRTAKLAMREDIGTCGPGVDNSC
jgi:hypothetical protein